METFGVVFLIIFGLVLGLSACFTHFPITSFSVLIGGVLYFSVYFWMFCAKGDVDHFANLDLRGYSPIWFRRCPRRSPLIFYVSRSICSCLTLFLVFYMSLAVLHAYQKNHKPFNDPTIKEVTIRLVGGPHLEQCVCSGEPVSDSGRIENGVITCFVSSAYENALDSYLYGDKCFPFTEICLYNTDGQMLLSGKGSCDLRTQWDGHLEMKVLVTLGMNKRGPIESKFSRDIVGLPNLTYKRHPEHWFTISRGNGGEKSFILVFHGFDESWDLGDKWFECVRLELIEESKY